MRSTPHPFVALVVILLSFALGLQALAQSSSIGFQAKLNGVADGPHTMTFSLYGSESGGSPLQSIGPQVVVVQGGIATSELAFNQTHWTGQPRWLGLSIDAQPELTPRTSVVGAPSAAIAHGLSETANIRLPRMEVVRRDGPAELLIGRSEDPGTGQRGFVRLIGEDGWLDFQTSQDGIAWSQLFRAQGGSNQALELVRPDGAGVIILGRTAGVQSGYARIVGENGILDFQTSQDRVNWSRVMLLENDGRTVVKALTITGGSDLAEPFDISATEQNSSKLLLPGMVVSIDSMNPGKLLVSSSAYDTTVAGVISGANGLAPGMIMGKDGDDLTTGKHSVAMTGRVWVYADESNGKIKPGDRLTTSGVKPGYAMKATDRDRWDGAVIGKAMTGLDAESGMVLVLVNLQ